MTATANSERSIPSLANDRPAELPQDRFFNPWRVPRSATAKAIVDDVIRQLKGYENHRRPRKRKRKPQDEATFDATVTAIVADLIHAEITGDGGAGIVIPRSNRELGKASRYRAPALNKTLPIILDYLSTPEMDFVCQEEGYRNPFAARNQRTRIRTGKRLRTRINDAALEVSDLGRLRTAETIILKAEKEDRWDAGTWLEYQDTPTTLRFRSRLAEINDWLDQAEIDVFQRAGSINAPKDDNRRLRRVFTLGSFKSGGRMFGGFWQEMKKRDRLDLIEIDGEPIVELDYGQMAPRLLYALEGVPFDKPDAYAVPGFLPIFRDGFKKLINALLFAEKPLTRKPQETRGLLPHQHVSELVQAIRDFHRPVAHHFETGVGHHLQFLESELMTELLLRLKEKKIVALPIHDAVLVAASAEKTAHRLMNEVFKERTSMDAVIRREV